MSDAETLIELRQVSKRFGTADRADDIVVLKDIDFSLRSGEIVAMLGRSGGGKSTLLRIVCGLTPASAGQVLYRGQPVTRPVAGISEETFLPVEEVEEEESIPNEIYDTPIEQLDLSVRVFNSLKRTGITRVGEMLEMLERGEETMLAIRNFGEKSLDELKRQLRAKGFLEDEEDEQLA